MIKTLSSVAAALLLAGTAHAAVVDVDARADSYRSGAGTGALAATLAAGETFTITVAADDLWSAGGIPLWSNANGLTATQFATGSDDSGAAAGTQIGKNAGFYNTADGSFRYGELVGRIGNGQYFAVGTSYSGEAAVAGDLRLFYWDSYSGDNLGSVAATVTAVPEPASIALVLAGLGIIGGLSRRRARDRN